ncbi:MAG: hypothetical protein HWN80_10650 [Candidatus Lokiarchaeota archaeon]|nr:hypothetical protein [Candidatus Lokiarchaeota archaeon]
METITHNLVAIVIQIFCFKFLIFPWNLIFTIVFAFISHIIVDGIAFITYHTPEVRKGDEFWVIWHYFIYAVSWFSIVIFIIPYWLSILFANIMDLWDWFILRPIQKKIRKKNPESKWGDKYYFHHIVDWVREKLFFWLPDRKYKRSGVLIEIFLICVLSISLIFLEASIFIT